MSKLLRDEGDFLIVRDYLHKNSDSYDDWELENGKEKYSEQFHENWHSHLYEVEFQLKVNKKTGEYTVISVRDGEQILT